MATLRKGSTGQDVRELQTALNGKGYTLSVDGIYGDKTAAAAEESPLRQARPAPAERARGYRSSRVRSWPRPRR